VKLNIRESKQNAWVGSGSDGLSVVFPGVIARFDGTDLQVCLKSSSLSLYNREFGGLSTTELTVAVLSYLR